MERPLGDDVGETARSTAAAPIRFSDDALKAAILRHRQTVIELEAVRAARVGMMSIAPWEREMETDRRIREDANRRRITAHLTRLYAEYFDRKEGLK